MGIEEPMRARHSARSPRLNSTTDTAGFPDLNRHTACAIRSLRGPRVQSAKNGQQIIFKQPPRVPPAGTGPDNPPEIVSLI